MPYYGRTYSGRKTYRRQYKYYGGKSESSGADRPDMWMQSIGMQLGYEKARLDYQIFLSQNSFIYSPLTFETAQERLVQLMATVGSYLKLGRALDGFKDLDILGGTFVTVLRQGEATPQEELLAVKYNIRDMAQINFITLYAKFLKDIYAGAYDMYSTKLNALPKIQNISKTAEPMPDLSRADDPRDLGVATSTVTHPSLIDDMPNKWISSADDLTFNPLGIPDLEPEAKRRKGT